MFPKRKIAGFFFCLIVFYAVPMAPWPGLVEAYGNFFRVVVEFGTNAADPLHNVVIRRYRPGEPLTSTVMDTRVIHRIASAPEHWPRGFSQSIRSSRYTGYMPTILTLALILATPLPWKRRLVSLCIGGLLVNAFVALMPAIQVYQTFHEPGNHWIFGQIPSLYPAWEFLLGKLTEMSMWLSPYYIGPTVIWLLVVFRRKDWAWAAEQLALQAGRN